MIAYPETGIMLSFNDPTESLDRRNRLINLSTPP